MKLDARNAVNAERGESVVALQASERGSFAGIEVEFFAKPSQKREGLERLKPGYPVAVELAGLRNRMPLMAFILLAVLCMLLLGFVCACLTDHPAQAVERALAFGGALPALILVWSLTAALTLSCLLTMFGVPAMGRSSPPLTQRFRF